MGQPAHGARRLGDLHRAQGLQHRLVVGAMPAARVASEEGRRPGLLARAGGLPLHQVHDLGADGEQGAERAERILGDERDRPSADALVHDRGVLGQ